MVPERIDNKKHDLASSKYKELQIQRKKKQELIKEIQSFWAESEKKRIKTVAEQFHLSLPCAKKYIYMSSKELEELDTPKKL